MKKIKNIALASVFAVGALVSMVALNASASADLPVTGCRWTGIEGDYCDATLTGTGSEGEIIFEIPISVTGCVTNSVVTSCGI